MSTTFCESSPTVQSDSPVRQSSPTVQSDSPVPQSSPTVQSDSPGPRAYIPLKYSIAVSWRSTSPWSTVAIHGQVLAKQHCRGYSGLDNDEVLVSTGWWLGHFMGETAATTLCFPSFQPTHKLRCEMSYCTRLVGVHSSKHGNWVQSREWPLLHRWTSFTRPEYKFLQNGLHLLFSLADSKLGHYADIVPVEDLDPLLVLHSTPS